MKMLNAMLEWLAPVIGWISGLNVGDYLSGYCYKNANYYSDKKVAENNARADRLMRQLRRFAVENAENELNWKNTNQCKYFIYYDYELNRISNGFLNPFRDSFQIYFDTKETSQKAIETFKDELMWYFTEYRDRV